MEALMPGRIIIAFCVIACFIGICLGMAISETQHEIHPENIEVLKYELMNGKVDILICEAEKINLLYAERIRLTGRPNP